jgi:hypothetical protein
MGDDAQPGAARSELRQRRGSAVARAVIDVDHLEGAERLAGLLDVSQERAEIADLVAHGNHHADHRHGG